MRLNLKHRMVLEGAYAGHRLFVPFFAAEAGQLARCGCVTAGDGGRLVITVRGTLVLAAAMASGDVFVSTKEEA